MVLYIHIKHVSSFQFALEEEEVWRAVLEWAKYHAGVPLEKFPGVWNEHEKSLVCQVSYIPVFLQ